jgi:hypothetical protein
MLIPAIPVILPGYFLHGAAEFRTGIGMNFVYTCDAFIIHIILANFITPAFAIRLGPEQFATELPPSV